MVFHLLVHDPDDNNESKSFIQVFHVGVRGSSTGALVLCLPRHMGTQLDRESSSRNWNWCSYGMPALQAAA